MTPEHRLGNEIRLVCGEHDIIAWKVNVGSVLTADGTMFSTGLPTGFPDLVLLGRGGRIMFVETKIHPRKPTQVQLDLHAELRSRGFTVAVIYSIAEFMQILHFLTDR